MKPADDAPNDSPPSGLVFGLFLLTVGLALLVGGWQIEPSGMTNQRDVGPRVAPILLGLALIAGGLAAATERWWGAPPPVGSESASAHSPVRPWIVLGGITACTAAMPWAGFMAPAAVLSVGMLSLLGARWWETLLATAVILGMVRLLFVETFQVVLPTGPWGF